MQIINYDNKIDQISMDNITFHGSNVDDYNFLEINWQLLEGCNYKCSYCFGQDTLEKKDFIPLDKLKHAVNNIFNIDKEYYTFTLAGGEVTYHPDFLKLVEYIYSFNKKISILLISNGSKNIDYFDKMLSYVKNNNFSMHLSVHFEYADINHIKELIILFNKYKKYINVSLMLHPEYKEKIEEYFNELIILKKNYFFNFGITELREAPDFCNIDRRYTKDFFKWIDQARNQINNTISNIEPFKNDIPLFPEPYFNLNDKKIYINENLALRNNLKEFKNFYCCGGVNLIRINTDGTYTGGVCGEFPIIRNIYNDDEIDIYKLSKFVKCHIPQCGCAANDRNNKYRDIEEAKKYIHSYRIKNTKLLFPYLLNKIETYDNKIQKIIDTLAWWIPSKKKRDEFRAKFK